MSLAIFEGIVLFLAVSGSIFAWGHLLIVDWIDAAQVIWQAAAVSLCCIVAFYYNDLYDLQVVRSFSLFAARLLQSFGVARILLAAFYTPLPATQIGEGAFFSSLVVSAGLLVPLRAVGYFFMRHRAFADRVLILGTGPPAQRLLHEIETRPNFRYAIAGVADDGSGTPEGTRKLPGAGPLERLDKIIEEVKPDRIVVALTERRGRMPVNQLLECGARCPDRRRALDLRVLHRQAADRIADTLVPDLLGGFPQVPSAARGPSRRERGDRQRGLARDRAPDGADRGGDQARLPRPGALHGRARGLGGRPFHLVKFRTMHPLPPGETGGKSVWARDDSPRITRVGRSIRKLRLDELPQLWNVLAGDMDLVGPRPEILANVQTMSEQIPYYSLRHSVRPGLTGWAQTRFGYSVSLEQVTEKMRYDLFYIKHMSLWLDLRILVDTVKIMLFGRGAR